MNDQTPSDSLQKQIHLILGAMIILTGIVASYLYMQSRHLSVDLNAYAPIHNMTMQKYNQERPEVDAFVAKVAEYGRTHPDFEPILKKYGIPLPTNTVAPTPPAAARPAVAPVATPTKSAKPAPSPAPAPKK